MHDWGDSECVTILRNCKKAIPPRDAGGKVIIVDTVVGAGPTNLKNRETQVMSDLFFMIVNGTVRDTNREQTFDPRAKPGSSPGKYCARD